MSQYRMQPNPNSIPVSSLTSQPISPTTNPLMLNGMGQHSMAGHAMVPSLSNSGMKNGQISPINNIAMMGGSHMMNGTSMGMSPIMPMQAEAVTYDLPHRMVDHTSPQTWEIPLRFVSPTGPVDSILISLLQRQRSQLLEGVTGAALTGPITPSLKALINPEQSNSAHPVASIISSLLQRLPVKSLPEKVALLLLTYHLMQWQISPSQDMYNNIPEWFVPRASQLFTGHPIWTTLVCFHSSEFFTAL